MKQEWIDNGDLPASLVASVEELEHAINGILVNRTNNRRVILMFRSQFKSLTIDLEDTKSTLVIERNCRRTYKKVNMFSLVSEIGDVRK